MKRRALLGTLAATATAAWPQPQAWPQPRAWPVAPVLEPDGPPLWLMHFRSDGRALDRFATRAGAWWHLLYAPMVPQWPMELSLRAQRRGHALQLIALDAAPADAPNVAVVLPLDGDAGAHPLRWSSRFMLPAASTADGVFVRIELWRADFAPPPPLAVRWRSIVVPGGTAYGVPPPSTAYGVPLQLPDRVVAPPSPLTQAQRVAVFELPIWGRPRSDGGAPRELPR